MAGAPPPGPAVSRHFQALALCACEYQVPNVFPGVDVVAVPINDDGSRMTKEEAEYAVRAASRVIAWMGEGKKILVTCYMGLNRSGLVTAIALCKGPEKIPLNEAIGMIKAARGPRALGNPDFVKFLESYCSGKR